MIMGETHREDPTKKEVPAAEAGPSVKAVQKEASPAEVKLRQDRQDTSRALDSISELFRDTDPKHAAIWQAKRSDEWGPGVFKALQEPKGSVATEREDLVEPMAMLAMRTFRRTSPDTAKVEKSGGSRDSKYQALLDEMKRGKDLSAKALVALTDRYPSRLNQGDLQRGRFDTLMHTVGDNMASSELYADLGHRLVSMSEIKDLPPLRQLGEVDAILEDLADRLADTAMTDVTDASEGGYKYDEQAQVKHRQQAAEILPQLKSLMDLRRAMSKAQFGHQKSADEVMAIEWSRAEAEETAKGGKTSEVPPVPTVAQKTEQPPQTPERQGRTFEDVRKELNTANSKSLAETQALVTPEVKRVVLEQVLEDIDHIIAQAKRLGEKLGAKMFGQVVGATADTKVFGYPFFAGGGNEIPRKVATVDYVKTSFDYDLRDDPKRAADLKQWTDMLD